MFVFVGSILLAGVSWVYRNFRRVSPKRWKNYIYRTW
jgi:hypothetical protein